MRERADADGVQTQQGIAAHFANINARPAAQRPLHQPKAYPMIADQS